MPTYSQRGVSILDAILNTTSTAAQQARVGNAFANSPTDSNAAKSQAFVLDVRAYILGVVKRSEAQAAVDSAQQAAYSGVTTDFSEAP